MVAALAVVGCSTEPECGEYPLTDEQRFCVVNTIDQMVADHYPFAEYKGVDMEEFRRTLWLAVEMDSTDSDFVANVNAAVRMLRDGHTRIERRALVEPAVAPVEVEEVKGGLEIVSVREAELAWLVGRTIVAVDGEKTADALREAAMWTEGGARGEVALSGGPLVLAGEAGTTVEVQLDDGQEVQLSRRSIHELPQVQRFGDNIGYLRLDTFGFIDDLDRIDAAINEVMDTDALMIDLRDNGGGYPSVSDGLFGRLIDRDVPGFGLVDVDGFETRKLEATPRGKTYQGEVVVLTNGRTYSASNYFAHRMIYHQRGILIGGPTGGGAAAPKRGKMLLPGLWFQVSSHVVRTPEGDHSESGLKPQIDVNGEEDFSHASEAVLGLTIEGDPVINRALQYLVDQE